MGVQPRTAMTLLLLVIVLASLGGTYLGIGAPRGESTYRGVVVDVEHDRGFVFRTTQIHMKTAPRSSTTETFCLRTPEESGRLETARAALEQGTRLTVTYSRPLWVSPAECEGGLSVVRELRPANRTASGTAG